MWNHKHNKIKALEGKIVAKDVYIAELEPVIIEVRRWISTRTIEHEGKTEPQSFAVMQCIKELKLILLAAPKLGKSRQRSIATRFESSAVGRRRNTDV